MQRVLDPTQIEAFATQRAIPRIRLPDPARLFCERANRLRKLSEGNAVGPYLSLIAALCDAQQEALARGSASPLDQRVSRARAHGMPLLQAAGWPRDSSWRTTLLELCDRIATTSGFPQAVASTCTRIQQLPVPALDEQADLLLTSSAEGIDAQAAPFIMAALQVYWVRLVSSVTFETVADHIGAVDVPSVCPLCGSLPVASIVRADKAYQGYRYLHCALCSSEWHLVRIKCSHCQSTAGIHYHSIEGGSAAVRAESCDACHGYRKICYQEQDMAVEPLAEDLASLALDLLMTQEGFQRVSGNPLLWQ
jgi:FdhE protein